MLLKDITCDACPSQHPDYIMAKINYHESRMMSPELKKFAFDFDDTITLCPENYALFMKSLINSGHDVRIVTARVGTIEDQVDVQGFLDEFNIDVEVIYCKLQPKEEVCRNLGWTPDVWHDDNVRSILYGVPN